MIVKAPEGSVEKDLDTRKCPMCSAYSIGQHVEKMSAHGRFHIRNVLIFRA